ncbi:MAG: InlB B-repeat-containing protein [Clostridiales bacterium]|jgi:hypothetical protein|nr:InlB B-repeat-containing protein [Clostridiales bacterium]
MHSVGTIKRFWSVVIVVLAMQLLVLVDTCYTKPRLCYVAPSQQQQGVSYVNQVVANTGTGFWSDFEDVTKVTLDASGGVFNLNDGGLYAKEPLHVASYKSVMVDAVIGYHLPTHVSFDWYGLSEDKTIRLLAPAKFGVEFQGFWTGENGVGQQLYDSDMMPTGTYQGQATTLYAYYRYPQFKVVLDKNGGSGGDDSTLGRFGELLPEGVEPPKRLGYIFGGYTYVKDAPSYTLYTNTMTPNIPYVTNSDSVLYAIWNTASYKVWLNYNGGKDDQDKDFVSIGDVKFGQEMPSLSFGIPKRYGYTFLGFFDTIASTGGNQYYNDLMQGVRNYDIPKDTVLYARWASDASVSLQHRAVEDVYTLQLKKNIKSTKVAAILGDGLESTITPVSLEGLVNMDANGGKYADGSTLQKLTIVRDQNMPFVSGIIPSREGYQFLGYWDSVSGGRQYYSSVAHGVASWDQDWGTVLYARWQPLQYIVYLDLGYNKSPFMTPYWIYYGDKLPRMLIPNRGGYAFDGWFDQDGNQYMNGDLGATKYYDKLYNTTLYARWTEIPSNFWLQNINIVYIAGGAGVAVVIAVSLLLIVKRRKA